MSIETITVNLERDGVNDEIYVTVHATAPHRVIVVLTDNDYQDPELSKSRVLYDGELGVRA